MNRMVHVSVLLASCFLNILSSHTCICIAEVGWWLCIQENRSAQSWTRGGSRRRGGGRRGGERERWRWSESRGRYWSYWFVKWFILVCGLSTFCIVVIHNFILFWLPFQVMRMGKGWTMTLEKIVEIQRRRRRRKKRRKRPVSQTRPQRMK